MQKLLLSLLLLFTSVVFLYAQTFESEIKTSLTKRPKIDFRLDSRNSFISSSSVRMFGVKIGMQYNNKLSLGIGYSQLISEITSKTIEFKGKTYSGKLQYATLTPYLDYVFFVDDRWELSIPVQFGFGNSFYENTSENGPSRFYSKMVVSYEPAITFQYRFLNYFGVGMGVGYRLMVIPNIQIEERFTSPVYLFKFKIYFQRLYTDFID